MDISYKFLKCEFVYGCIIVIKPFAMWIFQVCTIYLLTYIRFTTTAIKYQLSIQLKYANDPRVVYTSMIHRMSHRYIRPLK